MHDLRDRLRGASLKRIQSFIARAIHAFTIEARDPNASIDKLRKVNEAIHGLAGHMMGLDQEPLSASAAERIEQCLLPLGQRILREVEDKSPLHS